LGPESTWAAEASECAADQDAFWAYHDLLFNTQAGEDRSAYNKDNLKQLAADLDLDTEAFNECLDSGKYTDLVAGTTQGARSIGVQSTPAFIINGMAVVGAQPFEVFEQVIEEELVNAAQ
jgi:protein-disulfide isomerase